VLLHPWLVDLHDIGAGGEEVLDLGIQRFGIGRRCGFFIPVIIVLGLRPIVNGPGTVALTLRSVLARSTCRSRNSTGFLRRIGPKVPAIHPTSYQQIP